MEEMKRLLTEQNVGKYIDLLAWEVDPKGRKIYSDLLRIEEDRYAKEVACLDAIDAWIKKCDRHIAQLHTLVGKSTLRNLESSPECQGLIHGMLETKSILISLRQKALGSLEISEKFLARKRSDPDAY